MAGLARRLAHRSTISRHNAASLRSHQAVADNAASLRSHQAVADNAASLRSHQAVADFAVIAALPNDDLLIEFPRVGREKPVLEF